MEKPLLKITFISPIIVLQGGGLVRANFITVRNVSLFDKIMFIKDKGSRQSFSKSAIKSIEFIQPTDL